MAPVIAPGWSVESIDILAEEGARLHLRTQDGRRTLLHTPDFGVGRRGPKAAALARFAEYCGFGDRHDIYEFIWGLPEDWNGPLLPRPELGTEFDSDLDVF